MPRSSQGLRTQPGAAREVVVVDDHDDTREMTGELLSVQGWSVRTFATVDEAVAAIRTSPPVLVVTDLNLGERTGLDLLHALREQPATSGIRVVAVTGSAEPEPELVRLFDAYLLKPIDFDTFTSAIRSVVERGPRGNASDGSSD